MAEEEAVCLVCGKLSKSGVARSVDASSALYQELLQDSNLQEVRDQFRSLCLLCDRLVSQFEEITRERRAIKEELVVRLGSNSLFCVRHEVLETGEITDVSNFIKEGVNIFEIDVKSDDVVTEIANQIRNENNGSGKASNVVKVAETNSKVELNEDEDDDEEGHEDNEGLHTMYEAENDLARICRFCFRSCEDISSFLRHQSTHNDEPRPFHCLSCGITFTTSSERDEHYISTHAQTQLKCASCQKIFTSSVKLNNHVKNCSASLNLNCKECSKTFANKRNLRDHNKIIHGNPKALRESKYSFPCTECDKVFYKKSNLTSHLLRHSSEKPFVCVVESCGKRFKREKTMVKHIQLIHEGMKEELLCIHCGAQFRSHSGLRAHVSVHTGQETVRREVMCEQCDKAFRCKADLETHMVVHSRAKPFSCDKCDQVFSQKASLKDHENVHLAKFQCEGCSKAFGRERYLKLHKRTCVHLSCAKGEDRREMRQGEVQHIIISGMGGVAKEGEIVQVVQVPESGEVAVLHQGVQLVVEGGEQVVTLVSGPEGDTQTFQIVTQGDGGDVS